MAAAKKDPLLSIGKVLLVLMEILTIFSIVMVAIGIGAVLTVQRERILADMAAAGAPIDAYWAVIGVLAGVAALLLLTAGFIVQLKRIADSVEEGDPFHPDNTRRLARMGWYAIGIQLCEWAVSGIATAYAQYADAFDRHRNFSSGVDDDASLTGLALALVLFILARVFRHGTAMREELEGTV